MTLIDYILVALFFGIFIYIGLKKEVKLYTLKVFAINNREFSTYALAFTVLATWVSGSGFFIKLQKFYDKGFLYLIPSLGMALSVGFVCLFVIPRAGKILGRLTVSSFMGLHYNQTVRTITAILSVVGVCGGIAIQFKILGTVGHYMFPAISTFHCTILGGLVVGLYSYNGGIKYVVYTDIMQSFCFILAFIFIALTLLFSVDITFPTETLPKFNLIEAFKNISYEEKISAFFLFIYFMFPGISATEFQRISMGANVFQLKKAWWCGAIGFILLGLVVCWFAYVMHAYKPGLAKDDIFPELLNLLSFPGMKAILCLGIISMCMSTADSHINITAVILVNDLILKNSKDEFQKIKLAKNLVLLVVVFSILILEIKDDLLSIIIFTNSFYMPIISFALLGAIFDKKTSARCVIISSSITLLVIVMIHLFSTSLDPFACGLALNLFLLLSTHYTIEKWELFKCFGWKSQLKNEK